MFLAIVMGLLGNNLEKIWIELTFSNFYAKR